MLTWTVVDSILKVVSRNMSNLTPAQLEQFESTFRYFDRDESNTLNISEMAAALASLGIVYPVVFFKRCRLLCLINSFQDEDLELIFEQLTQDYGAVTFEAFINLLVSKFNYNLVLNITRVLYQVDITEDQTSPDQLREAFRGIAGDKVSAYRLDDDGPD